MRVLGRGFQPVTPALWQLRRITLSNQRDMNLCLFYHRFAVLVKVFPGNFPYFHCAFPAFMV